MKDGNQIYIEGVSPKSHRWEPSKPYMEKYDHPLWKRFESRATGAGRRRSLISAKTGPVVHGVEIPFRPLDGRDDAGVPPRASGAVLEARPARVLVTLQALVQPDDWSRWEAAIEARGLTLGDQKPGPLETRPDLLDAIRRPA